MDNTMPEHSGAHWVTSSHSAANTECVELAHTPDATLLRDSKLGEASPVLSVTPRTWQAFTNHVRTTN